MAACDHGRDVVRFAESSSAYLSLAIAAVDVQRRLSPVSDAPYEVVRACFGEKSVALVQEMRSHDWSLGDLSVRADKHDIFSLVFSHGDIEATDVSSILCACQGRTRHDVM